jgi:hypothetical protein
MQAVTAPVCVLATLPDPIQGIAEANGYVAYFTMSKIGMVAEPH